jgi:hypothetical protein
MHYNYTIFIQGHGEGDVKTISKKEVRPNRAPEY